MNSAEIFKRRLRQAVKESTLTVAEYAQDNHRFKSRTGALEQSVMTDYRAGGLTGVITLDLNRANYGYFVHHGFPAHTIRAKNKKALRWPSGGRFAFAKSVRHPGFAGDPFVFNALDACDSEIDSIFDRYAELAKSEVENALNSR